MNILIFTAFLKSLFTRADMPNDPRLNQNKKNPNNLAYYIAMHLGGLVETHSMQNYFVHI